MSTSRRSFLKILVAASVASTNALPAKAEIRPSPPVGSTGYVPRPGEIGSEPEALDIIANGKPIIAIAVRHNLFEDQQASVALMPILARAQVRLIGLEYHPEFNSIFGEIQQAVRLGGGQEQAYRMLKDYCDSRQFHHTGDLDVQATAAILFTATKLGMSVVGIDARHPTQILNSNYEMDSEIANNTVRALNALPSGERIAIVFGRNHFLPSTSEAVRLGDALNKFGGATIIGPDQTPIHRGDPFINAQRFLGDADRRNGRDGRPSIMLTPR